MNDFENVNLNLDSENEIINDSNAEGESFEPKINTDSSYESDYDKNKYGVSYSPDESNGYYNRQYGNYPTSSDEKKTVREMSASKKENKNPKNVFMMLTVLLCMRPLTWLLWFSVKKIISLIRLFT